MMGNPRKKRKIEKEATAITYLERNIINVKNNEIFLHHVLELLNSNKKGIHRKSFENQTTIKVVAQSQHKKNINIDYAAVATEQKKLH